MLPYLKSGDVVRLREAAGQWKAKAEVIDQVAPRSYRVRTEDGSVCRRIRRVSQSLHRARPIRPTAVFPTCAEEAAWSADQNG